MCVCVCVVCLGLGCVCLFVCLFLGCGDASRVVNILLILFIVMEPFVV